MASRMAVQAIGKSVRFVVSSPFHFVKAMSKPLIFKIVFVQINLSNHFLRPHFEILKDFFGRTPGAGL